MKTSLILPLFALTLASCATSKNSVPPNVDQANPTPAPVAVAGGAPESQSLQQVQIVPLRCADVPEVPVSREDHECTQVSEFLRMDRNQDHLVDLNRELKGKNKNLVKADADDDGKIDILEYMNHLDHEFGGSSEASSHRLVVGNFTSMDGVWELYSGGRLLAAAVMESDSEYSFFEIPSTETTLDLKIRSKGVRRRDCALHFVNAYQSLAEVRIAPDTGKMICNYSTRANAKAHLESLPAIFTENASGAGLEPGQFRVYNESNEDVDISATAQKGLSFKNFKLGKDQYAVENLSYDKKTSDASLSLEFKNASVQISPAEISFSPKNGMLCRKFQAKTLICRGNGRNIDFVFREPR